ncbi:MAG TPA: GNAT family protein [Gemmatimonadaceae bacterium]|nr:GNAT family protein [Gemmatimonadaceae bacterium]
MTTGMPHAVGTQRLLLRPWSPADAPALLPILEANVDHLGPWIPRQVSTPVPVAELAERLAGFARDFAEQRAWRYCVLGAGDARILGEADMFPRANGKRVPFAEADHVEIGYWLDAASRGQGLASEAAQALIDLAENLPGVTHVEIHCDSANAPSAAVARRLGFTRVHETAGGQLWSKPLGSNHAL